MIPDEVINLMQRRTRHYPKPTILKLPRSEDMRSVVDAEVAAMGVMVITIKVEDFLTAQIKAMRARWRDLENLRKTRLFLQ